MLWLASWRIGTRLAIGFAITLLLLMLVASAGFIGMRSADRHLAQIVQENMRKIELANDMAEDVHLVSRLVSGMVIMSDPAAIAAEEQKMKETRKHYDEAWSALQAMPATDVGLRIRENIDAAKLAARAVNNRIVELARNNQDTEALQLLQTESNPKVALWQRYIDENVAYQKQSALLAYQAAQASSRTLQWMLFATAGLALLLAVIAALMITRSITRPLAAAVRAADAVASGDLTGDLRVLGRDEVAQLMHSLDTMIKQLRHIVDQVRRGVDCVSTASGQIAAGNEDLSSRTEQQASSLQETAASMEQITGAVTQSAESARQAAQVASAASAVATSGGQVFQQVTGTMQEISASSKKIADIISVVDGIAFQTNLLALNAAVEAARAGESGRGFAVVAGEVRSLAQRSAQASLEIRALIANAVEKVEQGGRQIDDAGHVISKIVLQTKQVTELIGEISSASAEQSGGIAQINQAVAQMDLVTQQNASLVEQSAAAALALREQAERLSQSVAAFRLDKGEPAASVVALQP